MFIKLKHKGGNVLCLSNIQYDDGRFSKIDFSSLFELIRSDLDNFSFQLGCTKYLAFVLFIFFLEINNQVGIASKKQTTTAFS